MKKIVILILAFTSAELFAAESQHVKELQLAGREFQHNQDYATTCRLLQAVNSVPAQYRPFAQKLLASLHTNLATLIQKKQTHESQLQQKAQAEQAQQQRLAQEAAHRAAQAIRAEQERQRLSAEAALAAHHQRAQQERLNQERLAQEHARRAAQEAQRIREQIEADERFARELAQRFQEEIEQAPDVAQQPVQEAPICAICEDEVTRDEQKLDCGHVYHRNCIAQWWERKRNCPTCRRDY